MSIIYNKSYRVPVWIVVDAEQTLTDAMVDQLYSDGAHVANWPAKSFRDTVKQLARRGWAHVVNRPTPFRLESSFVPVAISEHIKNFFGDSKTLAGAQSQPWQQIVDRNVNDESDYERIFNEFMSLEDAISLSYLYDMGRLCSGDGLKHKVFVTSGSAPKNILQKVADVVIVVGVGGDVEVSDKTTEQVIDSLYTKIAPYVGPAKEKK